jgi:hypothetical protein
MAARLLPAAHSTLKDSSEIFVLRVDVVTELWLDNGIPTSGAAGTGKEAKMAANTTTTTADMTHSYLCWCGCEGTVEVTFDGGFHGTTCTIKPCAKAPAYVMAFKVPRSAVLEMTPA